MRTWKKVIKRIIIFIFFGVIIFSIIAFIGINIAYDKVFSRVDYDEYNTTYYYTYDEIDTDRYEREVLSIPSGDNNLVGYLYGKENTQGLIIISPGHRDASDIKLPEIMYFVDKGWKVLCYDYTGCYGSEGESMVGYSQAPKDLEAVISYVEEDSYFDELPIMLFGHSLGAYASSVVLQNGHDITGVVVASGFDNPVEQWSYSIKRYTGIIGNIMSLYANIYMKITSKDMPNLSAVDGINSTDIPVLIMHATNDEFYGNVSSIYEHKDRITNPNCTIRVMDEEKHNRHYNYFLSDDAIMYKELLKEKVNHNEIDKFLYMDHDVEIMDYINEFLLKELSD